MGRPKGSKNRPKVSDGAPNTSTSYSVNPTIETPMGNKTVSEIKDTFNKYDSLKEMFAATNDALKLLDLTKTETRTYTTYNRDTIRTYLKSPKSYESQLRNLSRYIYRLCYDYKRIIWHFSRMICGDAFNIIPLVNLGEEVDQENLVQTYYDTLIRWQRMDFVNELTNLLLVAWREDTVYAYVYDDSDQEGGTCFFHILDGDYCKVTSIENGVFRFAFD